MSLIEKVKKIYKNRYETPDPTPVAVPLNYKHPPTLEDQMRRYIRSEVSRMAEQDGEESFEEADDFDVGDDFDPSSPYEQDFDTETLPKWSETVQKRNATAQANQRFAKEEKPDDAKRRPETKNKKAAPQQKASIYEELED